MPKKSCALIGPGTGPQVHVGAPGAVTIKGMKDGDKVSVQTFCWEGKPQSVIPVAEDGNVLIGECKFAQVSYEGENKGFIACVLIGV